MKGAHFTPLARIATPGGDVFHGLKQTDEDFAGFGEAYFSSVERGAVKGWRRHTRMVMNLIVPTGRIRFVVGEDHPDGVPVAREQFVLSPDAAEYGRLTLAPGVWMAFQGVGPGLNLLLNLASIPHDQGEAETKPLDTIAWDWALDPLERS